MREKGGTIDAHFDTSSTSAYDTAMHDYIELIVLKNQPLNIVEDKIFRNFSKHDVAISRTKLFELILKLVECVEDQIAEEIKKTKGAIIYDGWTHHGMHFVGMFLSYCKKINYLDSGKMINETIPKLH